MIVISWSPTKERVRVRVGWGRVTLSGTWKLLRKRQEFSHERKVDRRRLEKEQ